MYWCEFGFAVPLLQVQVPAHVQVCKQWQAVQRMTPSLLCFSAGYGAPYGYSTAAPAYGTYSPVINTLEIMQKLLWQSKCGSPRRNSKRFKLLNHDNNTTFMP